MQRPSRSIHILAALLLGGAASVHGQAPPATPAPTAASAARAGADGFGLKSADGAFQIRLRGYAQLDSRFFLDDPGDVATDTFVLRRVRPIVEGTVFGWVDFRVMPDFGGGATVLQDAYVDLKPSTALRLRAGKFKPPVGLERLQSATSLLFVERAFPTSLVPNRDLGLQIFGDVLDERLSYAIGVFNGVTDGGSGDGDASDGKDVAGRLFARPFRKDGPPALRGLGLGIAASSGRQSGTRTAPGLPAFKTSGQLTFFGYTAGATAADTVIADGTRWRLSPQATYTWGPVGLLAEYVSSTQDVRKGTIERSLTHRAWQVAATYVLFGGSASFEGVKPGKPFRPGTGGWGALEVVGRVSRLRVDPDTFPVFADATAAAGTARSWALGLGWSLNASLRLLTDYERTSFDAGSKAGDRDPESLLISRLQIAW